MPVPIDTKDNWQGPNIVIITYSFLITVVIVTPSEHP